MANTIPKWQLAFVLQKKKAHLNVENPCTIVKTANKLAIKNSQNQMAKKTITKKLLKKLAKKNGQKNYKKKIAKKIGQKKWPHKNGKLHAQL